jgi:putative FmdB family regulatory protein
MPIYEYACSSCEHRFDELQKVSEAALVHCPECNEPALRKLLSAPKFRLKGQGWYETDFKTGDKRNLHGDADTKSKKSGDGSTDAASKSGDKASATPAAKKDSPAKSA